MMRVWYAKLALSAAAVGAAVALGGSFWGS
jgi:hypothetical protein